MASERICAVCAGDRFPPGEGWKPVFPSGFSERCELNPKQHPDISISTNARIFSNASRTLWICFPPIRAAAIMLKVDGVVDESTQRSPARSHLPDDSSSILNEFQVSMSQLDQFLHDVYPSMDCFSNRIEEHSELFRSSVRQD